MLKLAIAGPRKAKNDGVYDVRVAVKNVGSMAATDATLTVELPPGVLYLTQASKVKGGSAATGFSQAGQTLEWTGINLNRKGAGLGLKLTVRFGSCADGKLEMNAFTNVGGQCLASANPSCSYVEHKKGWTPCAPP